MTFALQQALLNPAAVPGLSNDEMHNLVAQARSSRLLASLAVELEKAGAMQQIPYEARRHFESALLVHTKQRRDLTYDAELVRQALATVDTPLILLKGAAYMLADLSVGRGRLITDIDILVRRDALDSAEQALQQHEWQSHTISDYDASYYRRWSHEIPALYHPRRDTTLDVHHTILPPTAAPKINAQLLFEELQEVLPGIYTLCHRDMVIHSATHLFQEGEFHHGLRDVWDLDRMLRDFPHRDKDFWDTLVDRARELDLVTSLWHGLNYAQKIFATPIPANVMRNASSPMRKLRQPLMDFLYLRAFRPNHPDCRLALTGPALYMLFVRSHYLRMPLYLLLPHLVRKAWMRKSQ
ncbi:MAG: hypothetical protein ACI9NT_002790 [Bacteroidia bacterium]